MDLTTCRRSSAALLAGAALLLTSGCDFEPHAADREYALSENNLGELADAPDVQATILGALEMLYGTPQEPKFMVTSDWRSDGYNPNWPTYPKGEDGGGDFTDEQLDALYADNTARHAEALALVEAGDYDAVADTYLPQALVQNWKRLMEDKAAGQFDTDGKFDEAAFKDEARRTLVEFYPTLRQSADFYRRECLHCHGNSGGGDGPTARFLSPLPRDYRKGVFKFTALADKATPRREDLFRIVAEGVYTTAMPSFRRFGDAELNGVTDYVRLLAMRGEVETRLTYAFLDAESITPDDVSESYLDVWAKWTDPNKEVITFDGEIPAPTPELIARGRELFMDPAKGNCFSCHGEQGLGNGASAWETDSDGVKHRIKDDWGHDIIPRNLVRGVFRFGRKPIDIYRRIYAGINGTPMPGLGKSTDANGDPLLPGDDMWALVHYVRSLGEKEDGFGLDAFSVVEAMDGGVDPLQHGAPHEGANDEHHGGAQAH
ncbi:MAG: c-type cytochrome [Planctomycetes bacterium]|nr:c-type cytochrome [Planctomycetota bacterium]